MKLKLDENIGTIGKQLLEAAGHDVMTVADQKLSGIADERLFDIVVAEGRALVTLDRDFGELLRFPPEKSAGIIILASSGRMTRSVIAARMADFAAMPQLEPLGGRLWIVEPGRVGIHQQP